MQFKTFVLLLATSAIPATAQNLGNLPQCALSPALAAIGSTGCSVSDFGCICRDTKFLQTLQPQIEAACSPADLQKALTFAQQTCASAGVTLSLPPVTKTDSSAASAASSAPITSTPASVTATPTSSVPLGPGPVMTSSMNMSASDVISSLASSQISSLNSAATSLVASIASESLTTGTGSAGAASGSASASASVSTAGAAAGVAVQGGVGLLAGAMGALLAL